MLAPRRETAFRRARREFPAVFTSSFRVWLWVSLLSIAAAGIGTYFAWDHSRGATVAIGVVSLAAGAAFACLTILGGLWTTAPFRSLSERIAVIEATTPVSKGDHVRVGLIAVRSELAACATRINEARQRERWWSPAEDPLPAIQWERHFAALADPSVPPDLHTLIETTYQACDGLNRRIRRHIREQKESVGFPGLPIQPSYRFRDDDPEELLRVRKLIDATNIEITARVDEAQP